MEDYRLAPNKVRRTTCIKSWKLCRVSLLKHDLRACCGGGTKGRSGAEELPGEAVNREEMKKSW